MFGQYDPYAEYLHASLSGLGEAEEGLVPRFFVYTFEVALTSNQVLLNQRITTNGDAPFAIRALAREKTGDFKIRLGDSEGRWYSSAGVGGTNDRVRDDCLFGDGSLPFLVSPAIIIPPANAIPFDLEDISGSGNTVHLAFIGHKLFRPAS